MMNFLFKYLDVLTIADKAMFAIFAVMFVLAVIFRILQENKKKHMILYSLYNRLFVGFLVTSVVGAIWAVMRYFAIPYLGIRFVAVLIYISFLTWFAFVVKYLATKFSTEKQAWDQEELKRKYIK